MGVSCTPLYNCGDGDAATVSRVSIRTARKHHACGECSWQIAPGDKYEHVAGVWDGSWSTFKTCLSCVEIRAHFGDEGWTYTELWKQLADNFLPDMRAGGPCLKGLSVDAIERLFAAKLARDEGQHDWPNAWRKAVKP